MTQKYQVKVSMKQAAIVETGIVLKQGDFGMQIEIEVLDFDVTGTTPQIVFRKAMGAVESTTITVSGNKYTYTFKGTELDTPGKCFCDLKLKNSTTQRISTTSFIFKVVADTMDGLNEQASSYSDTIAQIVGGFDNDVNNSTGFEKSLGYNYIEQGGFTVNGLNRDQTERCRTKDYLAVTPGKTYSVSVTGKESVLASVSYYSVDDYETPRSGYTEYKRLQYITIPETANYIRCIFEDGSNPSGNIFPEDGFNIIIVDNESGYQLNNNDFIMPHITTAKDLNNYVRSGIYSFAGLNHSHTPMPGQALPFRLQVTHLSNDVLIQELIYLTTNNQYSRIKLVNQNWGSWNPITGNLEQQINTLSNSLNAVNQSFSGFEYTFGYNYIEQGGFTADGLNRDQTERCRTKNYIKVTPGKTYSVSVMGNEKVLASVSYYTTNDYTTARSSYTAYQRSQYITIPETANYIRCIFEDGSNPSGNIFPEDGFNVIVTTNEGSYQIDENNLILPHITAQKDINDYTRSGIYSFAGLNHSHTPMPGQALPFRLQVTHLSNDVLIQELIYLTLKSKFTRIKLVNQDWGDWVSDGAGIKIISGTTDLNDLVAPGLYAITGRTPGSSDVSNKPIKDIYDFFVLQVIENVNGAIFQTLKYYTNGFVFQRYRGQSASSQWSNWKGNGLKIKSFSPTFSEISINEYFCRERKTEQAIAVYDGHIFEFGIGTMSVDGGTPISITCGHGNNCMFGETIHGDYPYLYCGSFDQNTCKVYVNEVTDSTATLVRTISFDNLSGYLNMCVDEANNKLYLFMNVSETTSEGIIDFVTVALDTGTISNTKRLPYTLKMIQDIEFYHGNIYVTVGNNNVDLPTKVYIINTSGDIVMESEPLNEIEEFEGISFDNGKMYIATVKSLMST